MSCQTASERRQRRHNPLAGWQSGGDNADAHVAFYDDTKWVRFSQNGAQLKSIATVEECTTVGWRAPACFPLVHSRAMLPCAWPRSPFILTQNQDVQNEVNSLSDAREFHVPERASGSGASHVPSQQTIPSPQNNPLPRILDGRMIHGILWVLQETFLKA